MILMHMIFFFVVFLSECCSLHSLFLNVCNCWRILNGIIFHCGWEENVLSSLLLFITSKFFLKDFNYHIFSTELIWYWYPYLIHGFSAFRMSRQIFLSTRPCLLGLLDPTNTFGGDVKIQCLKQDKITKDEDANSSSLSLAYTHAHCISCY